MSAHNYGLLGLHGLATASQGSHAAAQQCPVFLAQAGLHTPHLVPTASSVSFHPPSLVSSPPDSHTFTLYAHSVEMLESKVGLALFCNGPYEIILGSSQHSLSLPSGHSALRTLLTLAPPVPGRAHGTWCVFCRC